MRIIKTSEVTFLQKKAIYLLWNKEYPEKLKHQEIWDLETYLNSIEHPQHYFLVNTDDHIVGWGLSFTRDHKTWFAIILDHTVQGLGLGRRLLDEIKKDTSELNGWVIDHNHSLKENGEPYISPLSFYMKNDFVVLPDLRLESEKISAAGIQWTSP